MTRTANIRRFPLYSTPAAQRILMTQRERAGEAADHYRQCAENAQAKGFPMMAAEFRRKAARLVAQGEGGQ